MKVTIDGREQNRIKVTIDGFETDWFEAHSRQRHSPVYLVCDVPDPVKVVDENASTRLLRSTESAICIGNSREVLPQGKSWRTVPIEPVIFCGRHRIVV